MSKKLFTIQNKIAELRRLRRYALELVHAAAVKGEEQPLAEGNALVLELDADIAALKAQAQALQ